MLYESLIRPFLFRLDPEWAHHSTLAVAGLLGKDPPVRAAMRRLLATQDSRLELEVGGLRYPNPLGLAGGFDKNGIAVQGLAAVGFGSVEVGSISAFPSEGNVVRPRLFRLPADEAIVVYYGVPNDGSKVVAKRLTGQYMPVPLGVNLVETNTGKPIEAEHVIQELITAAEPFLEVADYFMLNLNCPNTSAGKSPFDDPENLRRLLEGYAGYRNMPATYVKVVPSTDSERIDGTLAAIAPFGFVKGIAFGLPTGKPYKGLKTPEQELNQMPGTLCGKPVGKLIDESIRAWYERLDKKRHVLVGIGGITNAADAYRKIRLGASLLQIYTALIYQGPGLVGRINRGLCDLLERDGLKHISDAIGLDS